MLVEVHPAISLTVGTGNIHDDPIVRNGGADHSVPYGVGRVAYRIRGWIGQLRPRSRTTRIVFVEMSVPPHKEVTCNRVVHDITALNPKRNSRIWHGGYRSI